MTRALALLGCLALASCAPPAPVTVRLELPERDELNPLARDDAESVRVVIFDGSSGRRAETTIDLSSERRAELDAVPWGDAIEVTVEVLSSLTGGLIGFGRTTAALGEGGEVAVPVRKLVAYLADDSGPAPLRALELGPGGGEAATFLADVDPEVFDSFERLGDGDGLFVSDDGRRLVVAGDHPEDENAARLLVLRTDDHEVEESIDIPIDVGALAGVPRTTKAVVTSAGGAATFRLVDYQQGSVEEIALIDDQGGSAELHVSAVAVSADGSRAFFAGRHDSNDGRTARVYAVDLDGEHRSDLGQSESADEYEGVRLGAGGSLLYAAGTSCGQGVCSAVVDVYRADTLDAVASYDVPDDDGPEAGVRLGGLLMHPDGRHLFVVRDISYPPSGPCCGGMQLFDTETGEWGLFSAEVAFGAAALVPDGRILGGLAHYANDSDGALAWIEPPPEWLGDKIDVTDWVGHPAALALPFGGSL